MSGWMASGSGQSAPTAAADDSSVITMREIQGVTGNVNMTVETESDSGHQSPGIVGQASKVNYTAQGGSVICADRIMNGTGNYNLSVTVKRGDSSGTAAAAANTRPSSKGPAVEKIKKHKVELIECLMADPSFILQHVHSREIITDRQYKNMKKLKQEETIIELIDHVIFEGQESCSRFLEVLRQPDVLETYPQTHSFIHN